ncbi:transposase [Kitasatospora sp. NPDC056446]|uniref:transposase n=1 Tax=Kitasatospora sp. NPDC056446 TaxID=3345819 RepID=UPI00369AF7C5
MLTSIGLALAGRAGARLADTLGVSISRSAVLRLIQALPEPQPPSPRVVGVDEYARRKGRDYGTVLIDIETRRPVDVLPDRDAATVATWLAERPGIEVVCLDRAPFFAEGARTGAPQAVRLADRWHLWHNVSEAAEQCVTRHRACLRTVIPEQDQRPEQAYVRPSDAASGISETVDIFAPALPEDVVWLDEQRAAILASWSAGSRTNPI